METIKQSAGALNLAAAVIKRGGVVICPTDTVYGFLADAGNEKAVEEIYKIKKRQRSKPLPVFVIGIKMAKEIAEIDTPSSASRRTTEGHDMRQEKILRKYWPGKYTFIIKSKIKRQNAKPQSKNQKFTQKLSNLIIGKDNTIGIRIPKYKFLNNLLKKVNRPLAQTSVNISGEPPLTKIEDIKARFTQNRGRSGVPQFLLLIIDGGDLKRAKPSKIIDLTTNKKIIVRA